MTAVDGVVDDDADVVAVVDDGGRGRGGITVIGMGL